MMTSFEIMLWIYNLSMRLVVTPLDSKFYRFRVDTVSSGHGAVILKFLPDHSWVAEQVSMKCFTKEYIHQLGKLIEIKKAELLLDGIISPYLSK
jgi:hypothetical protein